MSGLFDGLLKPGQGAEYSIRRELERRRDAWRRPEGTGGWAYRGPADFILRHGRYWQGAQCPEPYRRFCGPPQRCFENAREAALECPELRYVEGVYDVGGRGPAEHAWCIDQADNIVELTFNPDGSAVGCVLRDDTMRVGRVMPNERYAYFGVVLPVELVQWHAEQPELGLGVLHPQSGGVVMRRPFDPNVHELPIPEDVTDAYNRRLAAALSDDEEDDDDV